MVKMLPAVLTFVRRTFLAAIIVVLVITNVLSVTSAAFNEMLYGLWALTPAKQLLKNSPVAKTRRLQAKNKAVQKKNLALLKKQKAHKLKFIKARKIFQKITKRTANNIAKNVASIPTESVPYLGAAVVVTVTALDVKDGCDTVRDLNEIMKMLDAEPMDSDERKICGINVPSTDEVLSKIKQDIGGTVYSAKETVQGSARKFYDDLGGTLNEIFKD